MHVIIDDTNKRLKDLQVARDSLVNRAETTSRQLQEVQQRSDKQIEDMESLLNETKQQLEESEAKVSSILKVVVLLFHVLPL